MEKEIENGEESQQIIKSFGNSKEYLSCEIMKKDFKYIPIKLDNFESIDLIYNQLTEEITLDCHGEHDAIKRTNLKSVNFFKILYEIKAKDK